MYRKNITLRCTGRQPNGMVPCKGPPEYGLVRDGPVLNNALNNKPATWIVSGNRRAMP